MRITERLRLWIARPILNRLANEIGVVGELVACSDRNYSTFAALYTVAAGVRAGRILIDHTLSKSEVVEVPETPKKKLGRPKGSKNKVKAKVGRPRKTTEAA
ncbi:MAG: hypothetical protein E6R03_04085 [Hyphomicrobiaceae bacterium]|nr:MAG: hypothetical protein E6R03_04085 [Hyphomicrobiaceae bacterium]